MSLASPVRSKSKRGVCGVEVWRQGTRREPNGQGDSRWAAPPQWDDRSRGRWFGRVAPCDCHGAWYAPRYVQTACPYSRDRYSTDRAVLGSISSRNGRMPRGRHQQPQLTAALNRDTMGGRQLLSRGTQSGTLVFGAGQPPAARTCLHRRDGGNARRATRHRDAARGRGDHDTADGRPAAGPRRRRLFDAVA